MQIVHEDWKTVYEREKNEKHIVLLIDQLYKSIIAIIDCLELLEIVNEKDNISYFTSSDTDMLYIFIWRYSDKIISVKN